MIFGPLGAGGGTGGVKMASGPMTSPTSIAIGFKPKIVFIDRIGLASSGLVESRGRKILIKPQDSDTITIDGVINMMPVTCTITFTDEGVTITNGRLEYGSDSNNYRSWFAIG